MKKLPTSAQWVAARRAQRDAAARREEAHRLLRVQRCVQGALRWLGRLLAQHDEPWNGRERLGVVAVVEGRAWDTFDRREADAMVAALVGAGWEARVIERAPGAPFEVVVENPETAADQPGARPP